MRRPNQSTDALLEELAEFKFPRATRRRLTRLMDVNNEGRLTPDQRRELRALVEINERIANLKGQAMLVLRKRNG